MKKDYMTRPEVLEILNIKPGTLYAYVSRGKIKTAPHNNRRRSLYLRSDVERLRSRRRGRPPKSAAAESAMHWGEPVIASSITQIRDTGPIYRNRPAIDMARAGASFESVAHLLFTGTWQDGACAWPRIRTPSDIERLLTSYEDGLARNDIGNLLGMATLAMGMQGRGASELSEGTAVPAARRLMQTMAGCLGHLGPRSRLAYRQPDEGLAAFVIRATIAKHVSAAELHALNGAMIVLADNELAPATFAARIAASTNADLFNSVATAIGAHVGFSTGTATQNVETSLFQSTDPRQLKQRLPLVREYGAGRFGFNHPIYPEGDPRADLILDLVADLPNPAPGTRNNLNFLNETRTKLGAHPGIAIALVVLTRALAMPDGSAAAIWILSRTAGWVAHILEQRAQAILLRPRAKFIDTAPTARTG